MTVYSYYDGEVRERLRDHVSLAIGALHSGSRLERVGQSLFPQFRRAFEVSVLFHDFGKVFYNLNSDGNGKLSFPGHEVISAWAVDKFLGELRDIPPFGDVISPLEINVVVLAVMLHHHAMDLKKRLDSIDSLKRSPLASREVDGRVWDAFFEEIDGDMDGRVAADGLVLDLGSFMRQHFGMDSSTLKALREKLSAEKFTLHEVAEESKELFKECKMKIWDDSDGLPRRILLILSQALVAADYISAEQGRRRKEGETSSDFERMIGQFRMWYME